MDSLEMLRRTVGEADTIIQALDDAQLANQTPCTDWTVRDLINHITGGAEMFALSAELGSVPDADVGRLLGGDNLGEDYKGAWKRASAKALTAFEGPGVMDKVVTLPFGEMPGGIALNIAVFDVATHVCDLATSTGTTVADTELLESALAIGKQMITPDMRAPGVFGPEQPCADDAPITDRLLAFAGRPV